jgi:hypothetical protein
MGIVTLEETYFRFKNLLTYPRVSKLVNIYIAPLQKNKILTPRAGISGCKKPLTGRALFLTPAE